VTSARTRLPTGSGAGNGCVSDLEDLAYQHGREREGKEAVRDRAAERAGRSPLRVHVNPLVIAGGVGEQADLLLGHLVPGAGAQALSDAVAQLVALEGPFRHRLASQRGPFDGE